MSNIKTAKEACVAVEELKKQQYAYALQYISEQVINSNGEHNVDPSNRWSHTARYLRDFPQLQKELEDLGYKFTFKKHWFLNDELIISACCGE